jgi:hypothetical protein
MAALMAEAHVYAIAAGSNAVKIGRSQKPAERMASLQTAHYEPLKLAFSLPCDEAQAALIERFAHVMLREKRLAGEWFGVTVEEATQAIQAALERVRNGEELLPSITENMLRKQVLFPPSLLDRIDEWRRSQARLPSEGEAIRILVEKGLKASEQ